MARCIKGGKNWRLRILPSWMDLGRSFAPPRFRYWRLELIAGNLTHLPLAVVQRAHSTSSKKAGDAMLMKGMVTDSPGNLTVFGHLVGLAVDAQVSDFVSANGAGLHHVTVPGPHADRLVLLRFDPHICPIRSLSLFLRRIRSGSHFSALVFG